MDIFQSTNRRILALLVLTAAGLAIAIATTPIFSGRVAGESTSIPLSPITTPFSRNWSLTTYDYNANETDWGSESPGESQVFWKRLEHTQPNSNWTLKLGKGGQIYSLKTPEIGELIAPQRFSHGEWVDEVFQHTIPSSLHNGTLSQVVDGDIHQAGYYTQSDLNTSTKVIPHSVYSPTFPSVLPEFTETQNSFSFITWPQHAHLPRTYSENGMIMHQNILDLGNGVIEISLMIDKWSGEETTDISVPWASFDTTHVPEQIISQRNGSYLSQRQPFADSPVVRLRDNSTGGWLALTQSNSPTARGIGIVYGKNLDSIDGHTSFLRWGTYSSGTIATIKRNVTLKAGDSVFFRYYLVIGQLKDIQHYGNQLVNKVQSVRINTQASRPGNIRICPDSQTGFRLGCPEKNQPAFVTQRYHTFGSLPLFLVENTSNHKIFLTTNPYSISSDPTDKRTKYSRFLGWVNSPTAKKPVSSSGCNVSLQSVLRSFPTVYADPSLAGTTVATDTNCGQ